MKIQRTIAHQITRQVVFYPATNVLGDAQRLLLIGHNATSRIPVAAAGRDRGRDTTPELMWHLTQNGVYHPRLPRQLPPHVASGNLSKNVLQASSRCVKNVLCQSMALALLGIAIFLYPAPTTSWFHPRSSLKPLLLG